MSNSREDSPEWLRCFQPPTQSAIELSSDLESPLEHNPVSDDEDDINLSKLFKKEASQVSDAKDNDDKIESVVKKAVKGKSPKKNEKVKRTQEGKRKNKECNKKEGNKAITENTKNMDGILSDHGDKSPKNQVPKVEYPIKKLEEEDENTAKKKNISRSINGENDTNNNALKEDISGKHLGPQVSSSRLPLLLSDKVQRSKALVECEGDSIDLSGDVGSVGRVVVSDDPSKDHEMFLDLKGTIYKTTIVPSRTFCVVNFGQSEAKIEAIMNDYIQLKPLSNVYEAETMVEGTLDGFSFDSEDEADKAIAQNDQQEVAEEQPDGKAKRKADKTSGVARKKGKPAGAKPAKKVKTKPQVTKKSKTKK